MQNNIKWTVHEIDISKLKGYDKNPRDITPEALDLLKKSVEDFGQVVPLVVNQDYTVLGGNQRLKIMSGSVKVLVPDRMLSNTEEAEIVTILNVKVGEWDFIKLESLGIDKEVLISDFNFDAEYIEKNSLNLDNFDFDDDFSTDFEEEKQNPIKMIQVKFENNTPDEIFNLIENEKIATNTKSLEELILLKARKYESNPIKTI